MWVAKITDHKEVSEGESGSNSEIEEGESRDTFDDNSENESMDHIPINLTDDLLGRNMHNKF